MRCQFCNEEIDAAAFCKWCGKQQERRGGSKASVPATHHVAAPAAPLPRPQGGSTEMATVTPAMTPPATVLNTVASQAEPSPVVQTPVVETPTQPPATAKPQPSWQPPPPIQPPQPNRTPVPRTEEQPSVSQPEQQAKRATSGVGAALNRGLALPRPLLLSIAVGVPVLLVAVGVITWLLLSSSDIGSVPLDPHKLPPTTERISVGVLTSDSIGDARMQATYRSATLGSLFCSPDRPNPWFSFHAYSLSSFAKNLEGDNKKKLKEMMQCGSTMAGHLEGETGGVIVFKDDEDKTMRVRFLPMSKAALPAKSGWVARSFAGLSGHCWAPKDTECIEGSPALLTHESLTYWGKRSAVERLARHLAQPVEELNTGLSALQLAASFSSGLSERSLHTNPKSTKEALMSFCQFGRSLSSFRMKTKLCFPDNLDKRLEIYDTDLRAESFDQPATLLDAERLQLGLTLVARDEEAAGRVAKGLAEFKRDWRSHIVNNEAKISKTVADSPKTQSEKLYRALVTAYVRGMKNLEVELDGRAIRLFVDEELTDAERKEAAEAVSKEQENKKVARILAAIASGENPPSGLIADLSQSAVDRTLEDVAKAARRFFEKKRDRRTYRYRRYRRRRAPVQPPEFPPSTEGQWLKGGEFYEQATWLSLRVRSDDLALYQWRFRSSGEGPEASFVIEAQLPDGAGARQIIGKVDDSNTVIIGPVKAPKST